MSEMNPFWTLDSSRTLLDAMGILAKGVHRVCITVDDQVRDIVTQSAVLQYVNRGIKSLGARQNLTVCVLCVVVCLAVVLWMVCVYER